MAADDDLLDKDCANTKLGLCDPPYIVCNGTKCKHKEVFPMELKEFFGVVVVFLVACLAVASGIGGGGLFVPILILLFDMSPKEAIALSNGMIFFNSATKWLLTIKEKHPRFPHRPQIDYNIAIIFNPMILFGAYIGVIINTMLPDLIILITLVITIILASYVSLVKGLAVYRKETIAMESARKKNQENELVQASKTPYEIERERLAAANQLYKLVDGVPVKVREPEAKEMLGIKDIPLQEINGNGHVEKELSVPELEEEDYVNHLSQVQTHAKDTPAKGFNKPPPKDFNSPENETSRKDENAMLNSDVHRINVVVTQEEPIEEKEDLVLLSPEEQANETERQLIILEESKTIPWKKFYMVWSVFFATLICMLLQGAKGLDSVAGFKKCGAMDWVIFFLYIAFVLCMALWGGKIARGEEQRKVDCNWKFDEFDKRWTASRVLAANVCAPFVGLLAAAVGLGGGVSLNPTLLAFEFEPIIIAGTAMFLIMISKLASALLYVLAGKMVIGYWIFLGAWLVAASISANFQLKKIIKKFNRQSLISFVFVFFMGISVVMICIVGYQKTSENVDKNKDIWKFDSYCDPAK